MVATDNYAHYLFNRWKPTMMTAFPLLKKKDVDAILAYVENKAKLDPEPEEEPLVTDTSHEPCGYDTVLYNNPAIKNDISFLNNSSATAAEVTDTLVPGDTINLNEKDFAIRSGIYSFRIENNGWYNVDVFADKGKILLNAAVNLSTEADMKAYLFFPAKKSLLYGGLSEDNKVLFTDGDEKGMIQAPVGEEAILLVFGSDKNDMYYAVQRFFIKEKQDIILQPQKTTGPALLEMIKKNNINDFKIDIYKKEMEIIEKPCDGEWPEKNKNSTSVPGIITAAIYNSSRENAENYSAADSLEEQ